LGLTLVKILPQRLHISACNQIQLQIPWYALPFPSHHISWKYLAVQTAIQRIPPVYIADGQNYRTHSGSTWTCLINTTSQLNTTAACPGETSTSAMTTHSLPPSSHHICTALRAMRQLASNLRQKRTEA
jgi:hypothetical protein